MFIRLLDDSWPDFTIVRACINRPSILCSHKNPSDVIDTFYKKCYIINLLPKDGKYCSPDNNHCYTLEPAELVGDEISVVRLLSCQHTSAVDVSPLLDEPLSPR